MTKTGTSSRRVRFLLVGSLALNLLIIGLAGGAYLRGGGQPPRGFELQLGPLSDALLPQDRRQIGRDIRRELGDTGHNRRDRRAAFEALIQAVAADPFDPDTLRTAIERQQNRQVMLQNVALEAFLGHLNQMSPEDRNAFASRLKNSFQQHKARRPQNAP